MHAVLEDDQLTLTVTVTECAALWRENARVFLNVWHPTALQVYLSRWVTMPGDVPLCGHLDFRDAGGRTWLEVVDWSYPPHPQSTHPGVLARWEQALERHLLTWWSSLDHPRFRWVHDHNPMLLR